MLSRKIQVLFTLLLFVFPALGQKVETAAKKTEEHGTAQTEPVVDIRKQAIEAILFEIERAKDYSDSRERVIVWIDAADVLWDDDPRMSKDLMRRAFAEAKTASVVASDKESDFIRAIRNDQLRRDLRTEVLLLAQKREPSMVKELIATFDEEDPKKLETLRNSPAVMGSSSFTKRQIAAFASILAKTDPKRASEYALTSLGYGVPQELGPVFRNLIDTNPVIARQFFIDATNHFLSDTSTNLYDAHILASYLDMVAVVSDAEREIAKRLLTRALFREQQVWQAVNAGEMKDQMLSNVVLSTSRSLYKFYAAHYPERVGDIETFVRQIARGMGKPEIADELAVEPAEAYNDPEALIAKAEAEVTDENKDAYYLEAALAYSAKGKFVNALGTAAKAKAEAKRKAVENVIRRKFSESLIKSGEFAEATKVIDKIEEPELRVEVVFSFLKEARERKESVVAYQAVVETQKFLEKSFASTEYARAYLWFGSAYTTIEPAAGFDLIGSAIRRANQAKELAELHSEPKMISLGGKSNQAVLVADSRGDFRPGFRTLARLNLTQTLSLAENFENKYFRGIAVLASASSVLNTEIQKTDPKRNKGPKARSE